MKDATLARQPSQHIAGAGPSRPSGLQVVLFFVVLTIAATWPQALHPASVPPNQDSWFNLWRISWVAHQLPRNPGKLFDANIYYPARKTLAYSDATLFQGAVTAPLAWLGVPAPQRLTLLVLASFVFAGFGAWLLVRELTGSSVAGIVAGVAFAFAPYRYDHYMHLELLWTGWMPLVLLMAHRAIERGNLKWGIALGVLFAAQGFSCIYYSVLLGTILIAFGVVLVIGRPRASIRQAALGLACGAVIAVVLLAPYVAPYRQAQALVGERTIHEASVYSAEPRHYLAATPDNLVYGTLLGWAGPHEKRLFPGLVVIVLAAIGLWLPVSRHRLAYVVALVLAVDLSFGPSGLTYPWLREWLEPLRGLRALARAGGVALLMGAVLAGMGWARLERTRWLAPRATLAGVIVVAAMVVEYAVQPRVLVPARTTPSAVHQWLAARDDRGAVIELPMPPEDGPPLHEPEFTYFSTFHWHPLVNGYSGYAPGRYMDVRRALHTFPDEAAFDLLWRLRVRYIVLHERLLGADVYRAHVEALDKRGDLERHGPFPDHEGESMVFALRR